MTGEDYQEFLEVPFELNEVENLSDVKFEYNITAKNDKDEPKTKK